MRVKYKVEEILEALQFTGDNQKEINDFADSYMGDGAIGDIEMEPGQWLVFDEEFRNAIVSDEIFKDMFDIVKDY